MSIVTCPDCGHKVSDSAITCPNCGYPYENSKKIYFLARERMDEAKTSSEMIGIAEIFESIKGFQDADFLMQICRDKAKELPATNHNVQTMDAALKIESGHSLLYAILLTVFGAVIVVSSFVDGYFQWSFANSSLSGGTRYYYDSNFSHLISNIPIVGLIKVALLAAVLLGVLSAWISAKGAKHLELNCVITASVVLVILLICSIVGPITFTEHNDFGYGFYSYTDFENFGIVFYVQMASVMTYLAVSIISKLQKEAR